MGFLLVIVSVEQKLPPVKQEVRLFGACDGDDNDFYDNNGSVDDDVTYIEGGGAVYVLLMIVMVKIP